MQSLYIIGNGFDLYHGVPSRFSDFKSYLRVADRMTYDLIDRYLPVDELWSDLEEALAGIDLDAIVDDASQFLASYAADGWSDAFHHDYQWEIDRIVEGLSRGLKDRFTEWVSQLSIPSRFHSLLRLDPNSTYMTFNYTNTLSALYQVPASSILFIHGEVSGGDELILGHAWNPTQVPSLNQNQDPDSADTRVMEGNETLNAYFSKTFKNTAQITQENAAFFGNLKSVSTVYVLGHSLALVDIDYFKVVIRNITPPSTRWVVSYYGNAELAHHQRTMAHLGIQGSQVTFINLQDLR